MLQTVIVDKNNIKTIDCSPIMVIDREFNGTTFNFGEKLTRTLDTDRQPSTGINIVMLKCGKVIVLFVYLHKYYYSSNSHLKMQQKLIWYFYDKYCSK